MLFDVVVPACLRHRLGSRMITNRSA
jgi:hypothetical protein